MRRKKDHITTCRRCNGTGWVAGKPWVNSPHKKPPTPKQQRCPACNGKGTFKS